MSINALDMQAFASYLNKIFMLYVKWSEHMNDTNHGNTLVCWYAGAYFVCQ